MIFCVYVGVAHGLLSRLTEEELSGGMEDWRRLTAGAALIYIGVGVAAAYFTARRGAAPAVGLKQAAQLLDSTGHAPENTGRLPEEYRYVHSVLTGSGDALQAYGNELARYAQTARSHAFASLLAGEAVTEDTLNLGGHGYILLMVRVENEGEAAAAEASVLLRDTLRPIVGPEGLIANLHADTAALIPSALYQNHMAERLEAALQALPRLCCRMVSSGRCRDAQDIRRAFSALLSVMNLPEVQAPDGAVFHAQTAAGDGAGTEAAAGSIREHLLQESGASLYQHLANGNTAQLMVFFNDCQRFFRETARVDENVTAYLYLACVCALLSARENYPSLADRFFIPAYDRHCAVSTLFTRLRTALLDTAAQISAHYAQNSRVNALDIIQFINQNIQNPDLCIKLAVDRFHISESELQQAIRSVSGLSFFAYVERMRMREAKRMVNETDDSLLDIAVRCGYNSATSFSRAFKRFHGISPGHMRGVRQNNAET